MAEFTGPKSRLALNSESVWGINPDDTSGSGSASGDAENIVHVPVTNFDVRFRPENRESAAFLGIHEDRFARNFRGMPSGNLTAMLHGYSPAGTSVSLAQYLMDWAFENHNSDTLPSKTALWSDGDQVGAEHNGLRVNSATLQGSDDSGVIELALELMGKTSDSAAASAIPAAPDDRDQLVDFEFRDATFALGGSSVVAKSFSLQIQRNLQVAYLNSFTPQLLLAARYVVTYQIVLPKSANTYDVYRRATTNNDITGQIVLKGLHNGSLSNDYAQVTIDFDKLRFVDADDDRARDAINFQTLNFKVLKPDTSNNGIRTTWTTS